MSSTICFNLDQSKILLSGNALTTHRLHLDDNESHQYYQIPSLNNEVLR